MQRNVVSESSTSRGWALVATWGTLVEGDDYHRTLHYDFNVVAEAIIFSKVSNNTVAGDGADLQEYDRLSCKQDHLQTAGRTCSRRGQ